MEKSNLLLDDEIRTQEDIVQIDADPEYLKKCTLWAVLGGIVGIIMAHKIAWGNKFQNGRVQYLYTDESRAKAKKIQRLGLFIWVPSVIVLYVFYFVAVFAFAGY